MKWENISQQYCCLIVKNKAHRKVQDQCCSATFDYSFAFELCVKKNVN